MWLALASLLVALQALATIVLVRLIWVGPKQLRAGRVLIALASALMTARRVTAAWIHGAGSLATADQLTIPLAISGCMLGGALVFWWQEQ